MKPSRKYVITKLKLAASKGLIESVLVTGTPVTISVVTARIREIELFKHSTNGKTDGYTVVVCLHNGQDYDIFVSVEEMEQPIVPSIPVSVPSSNRFEVLRNYPEQ